MRWFLAAALVARVAVAAPGETLRTLSRRFVETPNPATRSALAAFAAEQKGSAEGALANLVLGINDYQEKRFPEAVQELTAASERATELTDYAVYYRALAESGAGDYGPGSWHLANFAQRFPSSPWVEPAARHRIDSLSLAGKAREALALLPPAPKTSADWALAAQVAERAGEKVRAAQAWQHVYYEFPTGREEPAAKAALAGLRAALGAKYPAAPAALRLARPDRLFAAGRYSAARIDYRALSVSLKGLAREQAAVRLGACDYQLKADLRAYRWLKSLVVRQPEAQAERLYYLAACARRLKKISEFTGLVEQLGREHAGSRWHEEALYSAGNYYLLEDEPERYVPYYRDLAERYAKGPYGAAAHWKVAWRAYLEGREEARRLLEDHLRLFPESPQRTAALYWLGRLAEARSDPAAAGALYRHLANGYPHYYHALLARERLAKFAAAPAGPIPPDIARVIALAPPPPAPRPEPPPEALPYLQRSRLLGDLGLHDLAERELRFRAETDPRLAFHAGLELAKRAADAGNYHQAIRFLKRYTPGYLGFPFEALPRSYWELLFPLPWRREIESYAQLREVDPYLVAALIRQESEFNPGAVSPKRARGLMQIVLPTGRKLGRSVGMTRISVQQLHVPETSLRLGILHLRQVLDQYDGKVELALAGYNAGEHRVDKWMTRFKVDDPAEFVENIPFTETRGYVQAVLRNAAIYRKLYGG